VFLLKYIGILPTFEDIESKLKYVVCAILILYRDKSIDLL
jgi:hypothetical protein